MKRVNRTLGISVLVLGTVTPLAARQQAPSPQPPAAAPAKPVAEPAAPAAAFNYVREGRRDPFVSLIGRGTETPGANRPAGVAGMLINEVSLKGIMKQSGGYVAMVQGTDKKTYVVKTGQRLLDGNVKSITQDSVVFMQDVSDPLSLVKQKEVRKTLRTSEEGRG